MLFLTSAARRLQGGHTCTPVAVWHFTTVPGRRLPSCRRCSWAATTFNSEPNMRIVTRTYSTFGDRAFGAAGPGLWNSLPSHLKDADISYSEFRRSLKTFLFGQWGHGAVWTVLTAPTRNILTYLLTAPWLIKVDIDKQFILTAIHLFFMTSSIVGRLSGSVFSSVLIRSLAAQIKHAPKYTVSGKKWTNSILGITSSNTGQFSKFFQCHNLLEICNNTVIIFPTTPQTRRYTTLWKTDVR